MQAKSGTSALDKRGIGAPTIRAPPEGLGQQHVSWRHGRRCGLPSKSCQSTGSSDYETWRSRHRCTSERRRWTNASSRPGRKMRRGIVGRVPRRRFKMSLRDCSISLKCRVEFVASRRRETREIGWVPSPAEMPVRVSAVMQCQEFGRLDRARAQACRAGIRSPAWCRQGVAEAKVA